jgi:wyosine [tRNA(Phe)-imidazoG37] synthetase (radical SAM superfamily)
MRYVFGPVPSRRLGRSLGVDLVPLKTCSYDCLYCQVGRTTCKTAVPDVFHPVEDVLRELEESLSSHSPDVITFSGSGEPTLHAGIQRVISGIRSKTETRVVVLTNGSLLSLPEVRDRLLAADLVMPTLCTVKEKTFQRIHRPEPSLRLGPIIEGMERFREEFQGQMDLEIVLLRGINDDDEEIAGLARAVDRIRPDRVQLNTVVRPPSDPDAVALDRERLEDIRGVLGERAEVIAFVPLDREAGDTAAAAEVICGMAERRPVRIRDVADALSLDPREAEKLVHALMAEGRLRVRTYEGEHYYVAA